MFVHVLFAHAMYFDFEEACRPRPASPGSAEALAAGPAAKEVDEEKAENGVIDTCGGREKEAHRGRRPEGDFSGKNRARKVCNSKRRPSYFRTIFGPGEAGGPFGPPTGPPANGREGKPGRPGA